MCACEKLSPKKESALSPHLSASNYCVTSLETECYNCVAWAFELGDGNWWPGHPEDHKWEEDGEDSIEYFISYLSKQGFEPTESEDFEDGFKKIAMYTRSGNPTHFARQLPGGRWTSKCGTWEDIEHDLIDLTDLRYGKVQMIFKRHT
jgi:hypothetical protein